MRKVRSKKRKLAKKLFAPLLVILGTIIIITNLPKEILIPKKENKEITWNEFAGERIPSEYKNFTTNEYEEYTKIYNRSNICTVGTRLIQSEKILKPKI